MLGDGVQGGDLSLERGLVECVLEESHGVFLDGENFEGAVDGLGLLGGGVLGFRGGDLEALGFGFGFAFSFTVFIQKSELSLFDYVALLEHVVLLNIHTWSFHLTMLLSMISKQIQVLL